jgi:hypothetical protein
MEDQQTSMTPKQQTVDRLKNCVSVVVTLGNQPSADEYASAIGLVQILRRFGKKASVITNTPLPKQLTFLAPGEAVTSKLDHLRDFVIELDKDKADKLRYEPSDAVVKIFITPYKQEITQADLRFSQGNYNVDTVIAIGATGKEALDSALKEHGKLLQDAMIITLSAGEKLSSFGAINWQEPTASTVAEMLVSVADALQNGLLDQGTAQVLLSALVAATDRFHNHKTTAKVMTIAAQLIAAGADPQIVMSQFDGTPVSKPAAKSQTPANKSSQAAPTPPPVPATDSRSLDIPHEKGSQKKRSESNQKSAQKQSATPITPPVSVPAPLPPAPAPVSLPPAPAPQPLPTEQTVHTSGTDNQLTSDAIDALMQGAEQEKNEFDAQPALGEPASSIPLMQHQNSLTPPSSAAPAPLPAQPAMAPSAQFSAPVNPAPMPAQAYTPPASVSLPQPAPLPVTPAEPVVDDSSIDAARQAVEQAVSQLSPAGPASAPASAAPASPDIYVAPDGTLQYAAPQSAPPTV